VLQGQKNVHIRREKARQAVLQRFDFKEMAQRSFGPYWQKCGSEEKEKFIDLFVELQGRSYSNRIQSYTGVEQTVRYGEARIDENGNASVPTDFSDL
jgi:ABC-type transporter MlaC component